MNHLEKLISDDQRPVKQLDEQFYGGKGVLQKWVKSGKVPAGYVNHVAEVLKCDNYHILNCSPPSAPAPPIPDITLETICEVFTVDELQELLDINGVKYAKNAKEKTLAKLVLKHKLYIDNL